MNQKDADTAQLNAVIEKMKKEYPSFIYINALTNEKNELPLGRNAYAIIIKGLKINEFKTFMDFVESDIFIPMLDEELELPLIFPLEAK